MTADGAPPSGTARRRLLALLASVVLLLGAAFGAIGLGDHDAALEDGWGTAEAAAFAAAEHAERSLAAARLVTDRIAEGVRRDGPEALRGAAGRAELLHLLRDAPQVGSIWIMDAAGRLVANSREAAPPRIDLSDRPFFAPLAAGGEAEVSPMLFGRVSHTWFFSYNRAVRDGAGRFLGVVQASMHGEEFQRVHARLGLGAGGRVGLYRGADLAPLTEYPLPDPAAPGVGRARVGIMAQAPVIPAGPEAVGTEGRFEARGPTGEALLVAWRVAGEGAPFVAVAAQPRVMALAGFRERLLRNALLFGLAVAVVVALGWAVADALARGAVARTEAEAGRRELAAVLEATADAVFALDPAWRFTFVNRHAAALLGPGLVGARFEEALPASAGGALGAACRRAMEARVTAAAEAESPELRRLLRLEAHPREDGGIVAFLRDVTEANEAALRLAESEARLRRVLDSLFVFVGVLSPEGTVLEANRAPLEAAGIRIEAVRGKPFWECDWWTHDAAEQARLREACARAAAGEASRYDTVVRIAGDVRLTIDFQIAPLRDAAGRITHLIPSATDVTARTAAEEALAESEARLRLAQEAAGVGVFERYLPGPAAHWSASMFRLYGLDPAEGPWVSAERHLGMILSEDRDVHDQRRVALRDDVSQTHFSYEFRIRRADTGEIRWISSRGEIVRRADGTAEVARGVNYDVTERRLAEERQLLLAREVDHRAKNALAVVQSIIALTRDADPERFRAAVTGRIAALGRAHTLLAREGWDGAELRELVEAEVAPYRGRAEAGAAGDERVAMAGPAATLAAGAAQPLAMALHELATNAAKYGALSSAAGRVSVAWEASGEGGLVLRWTEDGGPVVAAPPARKGFGSSVIRNTVERQLGGRCSFDWRREGLACTLELPARQLRWPEPPSQIRS